MNQVDIVILAAGKCSRFEPFNQKSHKSMFKVMNKPILRYTVDSIKKAGFKRIILVINPKDKLIKNYFGDEVEYGYQKKSLGMANAILTIKNKIKSKDFFVINAQSFIFNKYAKKLIKLKEKTKADLVFLAKKTDQPERYGIFKLKNDQVLGLEEKPKNWKGKAMRIVGSYYLTQEFLEFLEKQKIEEYQLEKAFDKYFKNKKIELLEIEDELPSLKYAWDLLKIKDQLLENKLKQSFISPKAKIKKTAVIGKRVWIEKGAKIYDFAIIKGPAYIGKDAVVGAYSQIRKGSILEERVEVQRYGDVSNSLIGRDSHIHSGFVGDSIIGENCRIGAGFITANKRFNREKIKVKIKNELVKTGRKALGVIMGNNCQIGIRVSTMPGRIIKNDLMIMPGAIVK